MSKRGLLSALGVTATLVLTAFAAVDAAGSATGADPRSSLTLMAPAAPGGGWDLALREAQQVMRAESIVNNVQVVNVPGAGGTIGLARFADIGPDPTQLMITGTVMEGAITVNGSATTLRDTTPIARLAEDYLVFVVPADSPFRTLEDFLTTWRADPHAQAIGGGGLGGADHLLTGLTARGAGIDPGRINYIAYSGGGEALTALLSGTVAVGVSGFHDFSDQIAAGNLRALAFSAPEPVAGIEVPTLVEQGVPVTLANWRGLVAPPGIAPEDRARLTELVTELAASPGWADTLARNKWSDAFLAGPEFDRFIVQDQADIDRIVAELGL
ncbi:Bug family tripartite tricarboxylate transporter substrate binding protein [Pseudonocardia sp. HH130630-07]|uniref:Bug family tripartite tricarboxylate transporter substrate binding protein n=1 Tax=Pseudonocardia sp. HH130630-07 TaxID=1690815 RepID=UPI000814B4F7|nr:tripartite tricarboxylate transporter substrate-binding protein [Pseudonocardia sp. HH130630-07]ANY09756.1 tricarboxylic transporter [Pseudonocardia sp. HH130630-07]